MANWYGIAGVEFITTSPRDSDNHILFEGVEDDSNVIVEGTMWERYNEDFPPSGFDSADDYETRFVRYMSENSDEVKDLIRMARGHLSH